MAKVTCRSTESLGSCSMAQCCLRFRLGCHDLPVSAGHFAAADYLERPTGSSCHTAAVLLNNAKHLVLSVWPLLVFSSSL